MPIINELRSRGCEVIIGTDGRAFHLLKKEYPKLTILELPAYNISYRSNNMMANIAPQLFKIMSVIQKEHRVIQQIVKDYKIDAIISDNRYGCHSKAAHSIFMTHQLNIKIPNRLVENGVGFFNKIMVEQFDECWIPDFETPEKSLSGTLSHPQPLKKATYVGALSRLKYSKMPLRYDALILLSGPEPQRTYLEERLLQQARSLSLKTLFVKGKTEENTSNLEDKNLTIVSYMTASGLVFFAFVSRVSLFSRFFPFVWFSFSVFLLPSSLSLVCLLNQAMLESEIIVTRSGYSTIMDLAALGKKAILIPTPGQTEQEYLAHYFHQKKIFYSQLQDKLDLKIALEAAQDFTGLQLMASNELSLAIDKLLSRFSDI